MTNWQLVHASVFLADELLLQGTHDANLSAFKETGKFTLSRNEADISLIPSSEFCIPTPTFLQNFYKIVSIVKLHFFLDEGFLKPDVLRLLHKIHSTVLSERRHRQTAQDTLKEFTTSILDYKAKKKKYLCFL